MVLVKHNSNQTHVINDDSWQLLYTTDLPDTLMQLPVVHLVDLIHKNERPDIILPLTAVLIDLSLLTETLNLIAKHSSRLGVWLDAGFKSNHSMEDLDNLLKLSQDKDSVIFGLDLLLLYVPAFADGRHFSLIQYMRQNNFQGEVRLSGDFGVDQLAYAQHIGVNSYLINDNYDDENLLNHLNTTFKHLSSAYSGQNVNHLPIFATK